MPRTAVEVFWYLTLLVGLWMVRPVQAYVQAIPRPHRRILLALVLLLLLGQLVNNPRLTFPFTSWAMYGQPEHPETLVFYRYEGLDEAQRVISLNPFRLLAPISRAEVASKFKDLARHALSHPDEDRRAASQRRLSALLGAVGQMHNDQHPDRRIHAVVLVRCTLDLRDGGRSDIQRERVWRVDLAGSGA